MRRYRVWDYSRANIAALAHPGIEDVTCVPIGYERCLIRIPAVEQDIDVLFYGSVNERDKVAQRGFDLMRGRRQAEFLALAIARF